MPVIGTFDTRKPTLGGEVSRGLASGLGGYLEKLADSKIKEIERQRVAQGLQDVGYSPEEAKGLSNLSPELQKTVIAEQSKRDQLASKESTTFYNTLSKEAKGAKENNMRLNKLEKLIATGKLANPTFASAVKTLGKGIFGIGIDLSGLMSPESQEFQKISTDFVKTAKDYFGSRLTDADLNAFLLTLPNLSQTNQGKAAVIENLKAFNDAALVKKQAADIIIRANGGRRPANLESMIDELAGSELDKIAQRFLSTTKASVEGTESLPGSVLRAIPRLITGS